MNWICWKTILCTWMDRPNNISINYYSMYHVCDYILNKLWTWLIYNSVLVSISNIPVMCLSHSVAYLSCEISGFWPQVRVVFLLGLQLSNRQIFIFHNWNTHSTIYKFHQNSALAGNEFHIFLKTYQNIRTGYHIYQIRIDASKKFLIYFSELKIEFNSISHFEI